jgi:HlyD family secretion protein
MKINKILPYILIPLFAGTFIWTLYFLYQKSVEKPVVFETKQPSIQTIIKKTVATGTVNPKQEINIKSQVSGIIEKIYVEPGTMIKKGDLIAKIRVIPNMANLNSAENRVNNAKISFENAEINYSRTKALYEKGVVALQEFQNIELIFKQAKQEVEAAKENLEIVKEGASSKSGTIANTLVKSTADGMLLAIPVKEGFSVIEANTFNEGTTIATVANMGQMEFIGKLDESEVGKVKEGMNILLTIGAIENEKFDAILKYISPKGVLENGAIQFEIKADVNLKRGQFLRAGYSANGDIILQRKDSVLAIEEAVLQFDNTKPFVEIETQTQTFEKRNIKTGLSDGIFIEIVEGLNKNDKVKLPKPDFNKKN